MTSPAALPVIDPARTALLAMDLQGGILPLVPDPDALVERVKGAIADVRAAAEDRDLLDLGHRLLHGWFATGPV